MDETAAPHRIKKRLLIPGIMIGTIVLLIIAAFIRGTWANSQPRDAASSSDGILTTLYQTPDGRKSVRCSRVFDEPIDRVWGVVTDYVHFAEIFPTLATAHIEKDPDGRFHFTGTAQQAVLGKWAFDIHITHAESPSKKVASWDEPGGDATVNRGSWTLTPLGADKTLAVYTLDTEVRKVPAFIVRNALLSRQPLVVQAVVDRLNRKP